MITSHIAHCNSNIDSRGRCNERISRSIRRANNAYAVAKARRKCGRKRDFGTSTAEGERGGDRCSWNCDFCACRIERCERNRYGVEARRIKRLAERGNEMSEAANAWFTDGCSRSEWKCCA